MSYRSFKRVLGETNLERKCLILFGACLFLLITGAFWYAERNAEDLVIDKTKQTGRDFVDLSLLRYHIEEHTLTAKGGPNTLTAKGGVTEYLREMNKDLLTQDYKWEILVLDKGGAIDRVGNRTREPGNQDERDILLQLQAALTAQVNEKLDFDESNGEVPRTQMVPIPTEKEISQTNSNRFGDVAPDPRPKAPLTPVSKLVPQKNEYHYFQTVYWRDSCIICHIARGGKFAESGPSELRGPLRVFKVTIPSGEIQFAMTRNRAILLATAIVTVFLSVITLYLVVRYVIVKPLSHLRDVSDEVSRGNTDLRADIQTNDEFEDLADSFNRMLRHLVETQEELRKVNTDLDGRLDQLAQANMQLHELNQLKSEFLANMSHELRTPLNSIIGFSDVLRGIDSLNEKQKRYVDNIGSSGRVLLEMINDILDLAKMEAGKMELRLSEFPIGSLVSAQSDLVRPLSEEKNIDLDVEIESDLPPMNQDQAKIQQILTNLLSNAIKFTPEGGRIVVSVKSKDRQRLLLTVEDTGVGIAEEDREVIFEKFRQGNALLGKDNLVREFSGTGLGLSIVKELCKLLGGEIRFHSELGKGSSFTAELPWRLKDQPPMESSLALRLNEVTKSKRPELTRSAAIDIQEAASELELSSTSPANDYGKNES